MIYLGIRSLKDTTTKNSFNSSLYSFLVRLYKRKQPTAKEEKFKGSEKTALMVLEHIWLRTVQIC